MEAALLESLPLATTRKNDFSFSREVAVLYATVAAVLVVAFGFFSNYDDVSEMTVYSQMITDSSRFSFFQDVHVFVFVGFGFLTSYLAHGQLSATGHTLIVATFAGFFSMLARGFFASADAAIYGRGTGHSPHPLSKLSVRSLIEADFAAAACLVSFGAVIGRLNVAQLLAMAFFEVIFYAFNEARLNGLGAADAGNSMAIHLFGGVFGVTCSLIAFPGRVRSDRYAAFTDLSNAISMFGTLFLFAYFPGFNAAAANSNSSISRSMVNTYLSLTCSCLTTLFAEMFVREKVSPWKIQRATLVGGIVIGAVSNMMFSPFRACVAGVLGALLTHVSHEWLVPLLKKETGLNDTSDVLSLHVVPGFLGGFLSVFATFFASAAEYGHSQSELNSVFPRLGVVPQDDPDEVPRNVWGQIVAQFAGLIITLIVASIGGLITGYILRYIPDPEVLFHDAASFAVNDDKPDTSLTPEMEAAAEKHRIKQDRLEKLNAAREAVQKAYEKKDAKASREAHQIERELAEEAMKKIMAKAKKEQEKKEVGEQKEQEEGEGEKKKKKKEGSDDGEQEESEEDSESDSSSDSDLEFLVHAEPHSEVGGDITKTIVFGALDGIMTTYAVVTAAAGGNQNWKVVVGFGFANLFADAFAMGWGDYVGSKAELDKAITERGREDWENKTNPHGEFREMVAIYEQRGFSKEDAEALITIHAKDHERFVDFMMKEELGIDVDIEDEWGPIQGSFVMFFSFLTFGSLSLLPYLGQAGKGIDAVFITSSALVGLGLLFLGAVKGKLAGLPVANTAISMLVSGILSGGISYFVGTIVTGKLLEGSDVDQSVAIGG